MKARLFIPILTIFVAFTLAFSQDSKENADFKLAVNLYNDKLYDLALEQFQQFINRYPGSQQAVEAKFYLGLTQSKLGLHEDARFTFQNFALSYPDNPNAAEAWWNVAESYAALHNDREAAIAFERIKVFHPRSKLAASGLLRASEYFEAGNDKASAEKMLRALLQEYPGSDVALKARAKLAVLALANSQFETARAEAQRIITATKEPEQKAEAQLLLAKAFLGLGRYQDAEAVLNEIIKNTRSSRYHEAEMELGHLKKLLGNVREAIAAWNVVASDSVRASREVRQQALVEIGANYSALREYAAALTSFERAGTIGGARSGEAWYHAGVVAEKTKLARKASDYYARASRDSSTTVDPRARLIGAFKGAVLVENFSEALRLASRYQTQFAQDVHTPRILFEAAKIAQERIKGFRSAIDLYQEIVSGYSVSTYADDALFGLGVALAQFGEYEQALQTFESLEKRFPSSELIVRARGEAQRIRLFELKSRDAGVEKLALLIGDVIAQKSKGDLAFRLAEIYFHDLKDYEHAAQHYTVALDADVDAAKRPAARYYLARSYEVLAWKASLNKKENEYYTTQALTNYELLLRAFPVNEFRDAAVVALYTLRLQNTATLADVRSLSEGFLKEYPTLDGRESITLALGDAFRKLGGNADALPLYRSVLQSRKQSEAAEALFQLAMTMNEVGKADSAFGLLERFLSTHAQHPRRAHAAWMAGQFAAERGKTQQAIRAYEAVEREYSYSEHASQVPLARAEAYFAAGDLANAIDSYQQVLARIREDFFDLSEISPDVIFNLAHCYQRVGKRNEAKHHYADFLVRDQSSERRGDAYYALASIAREEQNLDLAARYLQEASHSSGGGSDQRLRAALEGADLLFRGESYGEALTRYREVAREAKVDTLLQYTLARIAVSYFRMNNAEEADKQAVSFLKTYPKARQYAAEFEFERGRYLLRRNEFDKAKTVLETVIKKYDDMPIAVDAQYWLGRVLEAVGRNQEARKTYETIIERKPGHPVALRARLSLGNILYSAEQWDPAARHYKAILDDEQKAPDLVPSAMNNLILAYKELGLFDGALELTRKYIERFPTDPQLVNKQIDIGVLYQKLGYYDQAVFHLQSLLNGADADTEAEVRYYIGEAFYYKGDHQQAILEFLKVPYLVTRRTKIDWVATSFYMAGQSYEKMSKFDQAISMYKQILERPNIDAQFKTAAQKEIDRVNALVRSQR